MDWGWGMKSTVFALLLIATSALGQECTHLWKASLDINPSGPKSFSGDTYAVYALLGFHNRPGVRLEIRGQFPKGRFMSFETYRSKQKLPVDALFDYQMTADPGSLNPYLVGVDRNIPNRNYTVEIAKRGEGSGNPNTVELNRLALVHAIFYRWYVPDRGITPALYDLPRVYAFDSRTGAPTRCPDSLDTEYDPGIITGLLGAVPASRTLRFREGSFWNGTNHAIPNYVHAMSKVPIGDVSVIRFKSPTFTQRMGDGAEVRYWSLCSQDLKESKTLGCLPDFLAKPDRRGIVTLVVGKPAIRTMAENRGWNFMEDRRTNQPVLAFFYRNLLPADGFPRYEGEYLPEGTVCTESEFMRNYCGY